MHVLRRGGRGGTPWTPRPRADDGGAPRLLQRVAWGRGGRRCRGAGWSSRRATGCAPAGRSRSGAGRYGAWSEPAGSGFLFGYCKGGEISCPPLPSSIESAP
eukprot:244668-Chlamydomonas_euryale.AAC.1